MAFLKVRAKGNKSVYPTFTQRSNCESDRGCGKALAFNFPEVVNPGDVLIVRAVSDAFGVERLAI